MAHQEHPKVIGNISSTTASEQEGFFFKEVNYQNLIGLVFYYGADKLRIWCCHLDNFCEGFYLPRIFFKWLGDLLIDYVSHSPWKLVFNSKQTTKIVKGIVFMIKRFHKPLDL